MHTITLPNQRERKKGFKSVRAEGKERGRVGGGKKNPKMNFFFTHFWKGRVFTYDYQKRSGLKCLSQTKSRIGLSSLPGAIFIVCGQRPSTFLPASLKAASPGQPSFCKASRKPTVKGKKQKGSRESNCWECANSRASEWPSQDQSRSQSWSWSDGNRSAAQRREALEAVPRRLTNGNIWRLNYPLRKKRERENPRSLLLLSSLLSLLG